MKINTEEALDQIVEPACLPALGDDPADGCHSAGLTKDNNVQATSLTLEPSIKCLETPLLRGYVTDSAKLVCSLRNSCQNDHPTLCPGNVDNTLSVITSLPTNSTKWCGVGAQTRLAAYVGWIEATVEYLEADFDGEKKREEFSSQGFEGERRVFSRSTAPETDMSFDLAGNLKLSA